MSNTIPVLEGTPSHRHNGAVQTMGGALLASGTSINALLVVLCRAFNHPGSATNLEERRGQKVMEFLGPVLAELTDPTANVLLLNGRDSNPWVNMAEFPWLVAGRADIAWLQHYLPRAVDFSDDGITWRAGYGPRLRRWGQGHLGSPKFDQLQRVVDLLTKQPDTRQAVITLWDPLLDLAPVHAPDRVEPDYAWSGNPVPPLQEMRYKDYPCTNWLHFQVVDGALDLTVAMRSNDLIWGFSAVNVYNFTMLQQLVAHCIGMPPGTYRHLANNLHVYERHFGTVELVASNHTDIYEQLASQAAFGASGQDMKLSQFTADCARTLDWVQHMRSFGRPRTYREVRAALAGVDPWLREWAYFMLLHEFTNAESPDVDEVLDFLDMTTPHYAVAAGMALSRRFAKQGKWTQTTSAYFAEELGHMTHSAVTGLLHRERAVT